MSVYYTDVHDRVLRLLSKENIEVGLHIFDGFRAAQKEIIPWLPKNSIANITSGSNGFLIPLPEDAIQVNAIVEVETGKVLPRTNITPESIFQYTGSPSAINSWIEYPTGYISFANEIAIGDEYKIFYEGLWDEPTTSGSSVWQLEIPSYAIPALIFYAAAYVCHFLALENASTIQWKVKSDSGDPLDNTYEPMVKMYMNSFTQAVKLLPPKQRIDI